MHIHTKVIKRSREREVVGTDSGLGLGSIPGVGFGGQSDEVPPVPIPNTAVKLVSVPRSTGVGDPLGVVVRRHPFIPSFIHVSKSDSNMLGSIDRFGATAIAAAP